MTTIAPFHNWGMSTEVQVGDKHVGIDTAWNAHGGNQTINTEYTKQGDVLPCVARAVVVDPLTAQGTPMQASHPQVHSRLIHEYEITRIHPA